MLKLRIDQYSEVKVHVSARITVVDWCTADYLEIRGGGLGETLVLIITLATYR